MPSEWDVVNSQPLDQPPGPPAPQDPWAVVSSTPPDPRPVVRAAAPLPPKPKWNSEEPKVERFDVPSPVTVQGPTPKPPAGPINVAAGAAPYMQPPISHPVAHPGPSREDVAAGHFAIGQPGPEYYTKGLAVGAQQGMADAASLPARVTEQTPGYPGVVGPAVSEQMKTDIGPSPEDVAAYQDTEGKIIRGLGRAPIDIAKYGVITAASGGNPIVGMGATDFLGNVEHGPQAALEAGAKGAAMGAALGPLGKLNRVARVPAAAALGAGVTAAEGGDLSDVVASGAVLGALSGIHGKVETARTELERATEAVEAHPESQQIRDQYVAAENELRRLEAEAQNPVAKPGAPPAEETTPKLEEAAQAPPPPQKQPLALPATEPVSSHEAEAPVVPTQPEAALVSQLRHLTDDELAIAKTRAGDEFQNVAGHYIDAELLRRYPGINFRRIVWQGNGWFIRPVSESQIKSGPYGTEGAAIQALFAEQSGTPAGRVIQAKLSTEPVPDAEVPPQPASASAQTEVAGPVGRGNEAEPPKPDLTTAEGLLEYQRQQENPDAIPVRNDAVDAAAEQWRTVDPADNPAGQAEAPSQQGYPGARKRIGAQEESVPVASSPPQEVESNRGTKTTIPTEPTVDAGGTGKGSEVHGTLPPVKRPAPGDETEVLIPGEDRTIRARYEVRELADVNTSHIGETFSPNPRYGLQNERDYSKPENQQRVVQNSSEERFDPRYHITDNPDAVNGPIVIDESGNALGGNSRGMMLQRAYGRNAAAAQRYRDLLQKKATQFGIDPAAFADMQQPVLVRVAPKSEIDSLPGGSKWAIRKTNVSGTAELSGSERAAADAGQLSPDLVEHIAAAIEAGGSDATLNDALTGRAGTDILNRMIADGFFSEQERPALMDGKTGALTQAAKDRISKAMLGQFFRDADQISRTPAAIKGKLERIAAPLARAGNNAEWNLIPKIKEAVDLLEYARAHGITNIRDATSQESMFGGTQEWSPESVRLAEALRDAKPNDLVSAVRRYVNDREPTMFGEITPQESFAQNFQEPQPSPSGHPAGRRKGESGTVPASILVNPIVKAGKAAGLDKFVQQDVIPKLRGAVEGASDMVRGLVETLAPRVGVDPRHLDQWYKLRGERERAQYVLSAITDHMQQTLGPKADPTVMNSVAAQRPDLTAHGLDALQAFQVDFMDRIKTGRKQVTPELQNIADFLRKADDSLYDVIKDYRDLKFLENHQRVLWKQIPGAPEKTQFFGGRRPFRGSMGFFKQHVFEDMTEGIARGGVPVTYNPVEMFTRHYADSMQFITAQRWWKAIGDMGLRKFVKTGSYVPENFDKLNDSIAKAYFKTPEGVLGSTGEWYVERGNARLINNYLSRDLLREKGTTLGNLGSVLLGAKNLYTSVELGASGFHFAFVSADAAASSLGLGLSKFANRVMRGDIKVAPEAFKDIARGLTVAPAARQAYSTGKSSIEYLRNPAEFAKTPEGKALLSAYPDAKELISDLFQGGAKLDVHRDYINNAVNGFLEAKKGGNYPGAAIRALPAGMELMMKPLFEYYVPRVKVGVFMREMSNQLAERSNDLASGKITRAELARNTWDFVEDRFGEMNYDNVAWNRTVKTALQIAARSPLWRLGSMRAIGKAGVGQAREISSAFQDGRVPRVTPEMSWVMGLAVINVATASIAQWMWAHKPIESIRDVFAPRYDPDDDRMRMSLPTYGKEYYAAYNHPAKYLTSGTSGMWSRGMEVAKDADYYNEKIWDDDAPAYQKALAGLAHMVPRPISYQSGKKLVEEGTPGMAALSVLGINKAPAYISMSPAEAKLSEYYAEHGSQAPKTPAEFERAKATRLIVRAIRANDMKRAVSLGREALKKGVISTADIHSIEKRAEAPPLESSFKSLDALHAIEVFGVATPEEKKRLAPILVKRLNQLDNRPELEQQRAMERIKKLGILNDVKTAMRAARTSQQPQ